MMKKNYLKESGFAGHLVDDVGRGEDGIEIEPLTLYLLPLLDGLLDPQQSVLPLDQLFCNDIRYPSLVNSFIYHSKFPQKSLKIH